MKFWEALIVSCAVMAAVAEATKVNKCAGGRKLNEEEVHIDHCESGTCKLKRNSKVKFGMTITPEHDIENLENFVTGEILSVPLPFVGVDGTSACDDIYLEDRTTKASCPLKAGQTYWFEKTVPILPIYPRVNLKVHWALKDGEKDVTCLEVPAKIS